MIIIKVTDSTDYINIIFQKDVELNSPKEFYDYNYEENKYVKIFGEAKQYNNEIAIFGDRI